jgi:hypothetical protein
MLFSNTIFDEGIFDFLRDEFLFNSSVKDMIPTAFYKKDNDYIVEAKTLGISPDDVKVSLDGDILTISGESKNEYSDKAFNAQIKVRIGKDILNDIDKIDYKSQNGVTYVILKMKQTANSTIEIKRI